VKCARSPINLCVVAIAVERECLEYGMPIHEREGGTLFFSSQSTRSVAVSRRNIHRRWWWHNSRRTVTVDPFYQRVLYFNFYDRSDFDKDSRLECSPHTFLMHAENSCLTFQSDCLEHSCMWHYRLANQIC